MKTLSNIINSYTANGHMKDVVRGAGTTFIIKICAAAFSFGFNILLARLLGAEGAGLYFLALTLVTVTATIGRCGLENTLLRFVAAYAANEQWGKLNQVFRKAMTCSLTVSSLLAVLLFFCSQWLALTVFKKPDLAEPLKIISLAIVPFSLYPLIGESLKGLGRIRDSQLVQGLISPLLSCLGLALIGKSFGVKGASFVYLVSASLAFFLGRALWHRAIRPSDNPASFSWKKLLGSCMPLLWIQVMYLVMNWTSFFVLGFWGTEADIGFFGVAQKTAMLTSFILVSVNSIVAPKFAALYAKGDIKSLKTLARQSTALMTIIATPVLAVFVLAPEFVMGFFGPEFRDAAMLLVILSVGEFINVATGSVGFLLIMTGHERLMRNNTFVVGMLVIALNVLLIPKLGATGAAIATASGMAFINLGAFFLVWKVLGICTLPTLRKTENT